MKQFFASLARGYLANYTGLPAAGWKIIAISLFEATFGTLCFFLPIYFVGELHFTITTSGELLTAYGVGTIMGGILGGKLTDSFQMHRIVMGSLLIQAAAYVSLVWFHAPLEIMGILWVIGVASYVFLTSANVWALKLCRDEDTRRKTINLLYMASNLGIGLSSVIVALLAAFGFRWIFLLSGTLLLMTALFSNTKYLADDAKVPNGSLSAGSEMRQPMQANRKVITLILGCVFLVGFMIWQRTATYALYIQENFPHAGIRGVSFLFAINPFMIVCFQAPIVNYFKRVNKIVMTGMGAFLMGFGALMAVTPFFWFNVPAMIVYTVGEMVFFATAQLVCFEQGAPHKKGHSYGLFKTVYATSIVVGPLLGSVIYHHLGRHAPWYVSGTMGTVALLACCYYRKYERSAIDPRLECID